MPDFREIELNYTDAQTARKVIERFHYMKTYPSGAKVNVALTHKNKIIGIFVFGYSSQTDKKIEKLVENLTKKDYLEMQRIWISDDFGHNTESFVFSRIVKMLEKDLGLKMLVTHAGGCKDDCGIVYQASNWLYFGKQASNDFYLTKAGEYKNIIAPMRFGRIDSKGKTPQEIGEELFGEGKIIYAHRYFYAYPIEKSLRKRLSKLGLEYPKESARFRKDQKWVDEASDDER
jgi:hypothetical protein